MWSNCIQIVFFAKEFDGFSCRFAGTQTKGWEGNPLLCNAGAGLGTVFNWKPEIGFYPAKFQSSLKTLLPHFGHLLSKIESDKNRCGSKKKLQRANNRKVGREPHLMHLM